MISVVVPATSSFQPSAHSGPERGARCGVALLRRVVGSRLFRPRPPLFRTAQRGIVFPLLLGSILILGIASAGVAQLWSVQVKREKEAELIFRLGEFRRAILRYRTDHNRLPKELKDLLLDSSQLVTRRYLRQVYTDPMTGKADWQLKLVVDRTGASSGIEDVHSRSDGKPLKTLSTQTGVVVTNYKDW